MFKRLVLLVWFCWQWVAQAQFSDSFNDGNYTVNPVWTANTGDFVISNNQLKSAAVGAAQFGINTLLGTGTINTWSFNVDLGFNPSSSNFTSIFLSSDSVVSKCKNGYFVKIGNTKDEISLYKQTNGVAAEIISGTDGVLNASSNNWDVKVTLINDTWKLYTKPNGSVTYGLEGDFAESNVNLGSYFGIFVVQTASNSGKHLFDNIFVGVPPLDTVAPRLLSATASSNNIVNLFFDEPVQTLSNAEILINNVAVTAVSASFPSPVVQVTAATPFVQNNTYTAVVLNAKDERNNTRPVSNAKFTYFVPDTAIAGDIIITEIMSNPSPSVGVLPAYEYCEIYNRSDKYIAMGHYYFTDASSKVLLADSIMPPKSYRIISKGTEDMSAFGPWLPVSSMPSLNNDGDYLSLTSKKGYVVCDINYTTDWHTDGLKRNGGWSLEMKDTQKYCIATDNFASNSTVGGTPGQANSAYMPIQLSQFKSTHSVAYSNGLIYIYFNEKLGDCSNCSVVLNPGNQSLTLDSINLNYVVCSGANLQNNKVYTLNLSEFTSCDGRIENSATLKTGIKDAVVDAYDLLINELLFNPKNYDNDYIELVNRSSKIIDLKDVFISSYDDNGFIGAVYAAAHDAFYLYPGEYVAVTTSAINTKNYFNPPDTAKIIEISNLPTLSNDKGNVVLVTKTNVIVHQFYYSSKMHYELLVSDEGVSLERMHTQVSPENWTSASYTYNYGTPGYKNSQYVDLDADKTVFCNLIWPVVSPDNDGWQDELQIKINSPNLPAAVNLYIYNEYGILIEQTISNQLIGSNELITYNAVHNGAPLPVGNYIAYLEIIESTGKINKEKKVFSVIQKK